MLDRHAQKPYFVIGLILILLLFTCSKDDSETITIKPKRSNDVLINPGKGWVLMAWMPDEKSEDALELASTAYIRFDWAAIEPEEGKYNWEYIDKPLDAWSKIGKKFAFGVMGANVHSQREYVTPKWVFDAGAVSRDGTSERGQHQVNPESWEHPVYLEKLENFITAMGKRYDNDPRIAYIDIRSYGNWGEGHLYKIGGQTISPDGLRKYIKIYMNAFPNTRLILPWGVEELNEVYDWAVNQDIGMRRDGVLGNSNGSELVRCKEKTPAVIEWFGSFSKFSKLYEEKGYDFDKALLNATNLSCATYQNLGQYLEDSQLFLDEKRELIEELTNRMGYHFVLREVKTEKTIKAKKSFYIDFKWENQGLAPIFIPCNVKLALFDMDGNISATSDLPGCNCSEWKPGETTIETSQAKLTAEPGNYKLATGLFTDKNRTNPDIGLGIDTETINKWHILCDIKIK